MEASVPRGVVVVPVRPGPLIRLDCSPGRARDDLDELIDDLLPDTDERPGWFDAGLLFVGVVLIGWEAFAGGPPVALVLGFLTVALGCILPARSAWRRAQRLRRSRRREATLARGVPMRMTDPVIERLVRAYDALVSSAGGAKLLGMSAIAAGHSALVDAASLLQGRAPDSVGERNYVEQRAVAIEKLTQALQEQQGGLPDPATTGLDPIAVLQAREELDTIGGLNTLTRLEELTVEVRAQRANG